MYCKFDHIRSLRVHIILQLCLIFQFHYVCMSRRNAFYIILYLIICIFWRNANFHNLQCCFTFVKSDTLLEAQLSIVTNTVCQAAFNSYNNSSSPPTVSSLLSPYSHQVTYNLRAKEVVFTWSSLFSVLNFFFMKKILVSKLVFHKKSSLLGKDCWLGCENK